MYRVLLAEYSFIPGVTKKILPIKALAHQEINA